jgi:isopropylmalate/homocitrate/citramalate synthase
MALAAGVEVAHVTVSGLGERAGNTPLEEVVVSLLTQYGIDLGLRYDKLYELSRLVRELSGHVVPTNRPIVGDRLFDVESGIIVDWWRNCGDDHILELFPFHWELVGQRPPRLILGKLSGTSSIRMALEKRGITATEAQISEILLRVKQASIRKKGEISEQEFDTILATVLSRSGAG